VSAKLYDTAQNLLVKELSTAKNKNEKAIIKEIDALFKTEEPAS
jgi:CarD family transcriptional regulator